MEVKDIIMRLRKLSREMGWHSRPPEYIIVTNEEYRLLAEDLRDTSERIGRILTAEEIKPYPAPIFFRGIPVVCGASLQELELVGRDPNAHLGVKC